MSQVLEYFKLVSSIPRGSGHEKLISNAMIKFARNHKLEVRRDKANNVYIYKPAMGGMWDSEPIILQGHLDMVWEKDKDTEFDFLTNGINLEVEGDFISAKGTTLGADNGVAIAYMMAILADKTLLHPRLCCVMTTEEETGMGGAASLVPEYIEGKILINLDTDNEGEFLVSCAGGARCEITADISYVNVDADEIGFNIRVGGLLGGHSGAEIHKERGNANIIMAQILDVLIDEFDIGIATIDGGTKDNVITRECDAIISIKEADRERLFKRITELESNIYSTFKSHDGGVLISILPCEITKKIVNKRQIVDILLLSPNGIIEMSQEISGLVQTSLNMGVVDTTDDKVSVIFAVRSSKESSKQLIIKKLSNIARVLNINFKCYSEYPAWEYNEKSKIRDRAVQLYREMYKIEPDEEGPEIKAIHAGLECGFLTEKIPDVDIIAFGPNVYDIHTPKERMSISSFERVYEFLVKLLAKTEVKIEN
ncbi:MAG: hypothetical protein BEN19_03480 [Epulopiscium sp. Nuni2H_MBin003]|nr:MAG: hypothetical protein BEN19_03480 [Epulopiscium sp. Nuni2H_MBin003]